MLKQSKKTKFTRGKQVWTENHESIVKQLFVDGIVNPADIRKTSIKWIFTDPKYPLFHHFADKDKWSILQRHLKRLSTVYISEKAAAGERVSPSSKSKFFICITWTA